MHTCFLIPAGRPFWSRTNLVRLSSELTSSGSVVALSTSAARFIHSFFFSYCGHKTRPSVLGMASGTGAGTHALVQAGATERIDTSPAPSQRLQSWPEHPETPAKPKSQYCKVLNEHHIQTGSQAYISSSSFHSPAWVPSPTWFRRQKQAATLKVNRPHRTFTGGKCCEDSVDS